MKIFEAKLDCDPVEKIIWDAISFDYGCEFGGIKELSVSELVALQVACAMQASLKISMPELNRED